LNPLALACVRWKNSPFQGQLVFLGIALRLFVVTKKQSRSLSHIVTEQRLVLRYKFS
jgi:hypothetical protein